MQGEGRMVVDSQKRKNVTGGMITARRSIKDVNAMEDCTRRFLKRGGGGVAFAGAEKCCR